MQYLPSVPSNNKLIEDFVNFNRLIASFQANNQNYKKDETRDISLLKIKKSYPNVKLLVDTQSAKFPQKVMKILSRTDWSDIISWTPSGKAFRIYDKERLMQVLTPYYYLEVTKFENFRRKLYSWGFRIQQTGVDYGAWYHENFIRSKPELCLKIARIPTSKTAKGKSTNLLGSQKAKNSQDKSDALSYRSSELKSTKVGFKKVLKYRKDVELSAGLAKSETNEKEASVNLSTERDCVMDVADVLLNLGKYSPSA